MAQSGYLRKPGFCAECGHLASKMRVCRAWAASRSEMRRGEVGRQTKSREGWVWERVARPGSQAGE